MGGGNGPGFFSRSFRVHGVHITDTKLLGGGSVNTCDRDEGAVSPSGVPPRDVSRLPVAGAFVCKMVPFAQSTAVVTEILTMTCIAVERHRGLVHPFRTPWRSTPRRACTVLGKAPGTSGRGGVGRGGLRGVRSGPRVPHQPWRTHSRLRLTSSA